MKAEGQMTEIKSFSRTPEFGEKQYLFLIMQTLIFTFRGSINRKERGGNKCTDGD
jgi:hypothetical protein